jgi:hypothetical protein
VKTVIVLTAVASAVLLPSWVISNPAYAIPAVFLIMGPVVLAAWFVRGVVFGKWGG